MAVQTICCKCGTKTRKFTCPKKSCKHRICTSCVVEK